MKFLLLLDDALDPIRVAGEFLSVFLEVIDIPQQFLFLVLLGFLGNPGGLELLREAVELFFSVGDVG